MNIEYHLNLDEDFYIPGYKTIKHEKFKFPGGESHITFDPAAIYRIEKDDTVVILSRLKSGDDIMMLLLAKDALDRLKIKNIELFIPYLPYARQDRITGYEPLSMAVMANIINSMNFKRVTIVDAHSDVSLALIKNVHNKDMYPYLALAYKELNTQPHLIFPDAGAFKKYYSVSELFRDSKYPIVASKHRDTKTGKLNDFRLVQLPKKGCDCLIVDDICDGGRTFIEVAKLLLDGGANRVFLYTTHGIYSNGFDELKKYFTKIYCTNSFKDTKDDLVKQFKILSI